MIYHVTTLIVTMTYMGDMRRYALVVEGYQKRTPGQASKLLGWYWGAVSGMRDILRRDYGFPQENITLLFQEMNVGPGIDGISTKANIERELTRLASIMTAEDMFFCFFVDHGHFDGSSSHFQLQDGTITDERMNELAGRIRAGRQVWVFTQCQSGGFAKKMGRPGRIIMSSTMDNENNRESFAEPCRDGLAWPMMREEAPSIVQGYEGALESVWRIFRERHRKGEPLQEHCLLNTGSGAEYGNSFKLSGVMGGVAIPGHEFVVRFPVVSADSQRLMEGTNILVRHELYNPSKKEIRLNSVFVASRDPDGKNRDFGHVTDLILPSQGSYLFEARIKLDKSGPWTLWPSFQRDGRWGPRFLETRFLTEDILPVSEAYRWKLGDRRNLFMAEVPGGRLALTAFWPDHGGGGARPGDEITFRISGVHGLRGGYLIIMGPGGEARIDLRPCTIEGIGTCLEGVGTPSGEGRWEVACLVDTGGGTKDVGTRAQMEIGRAS